MLKTSFTCKWKNKILFTQKEKKYYYSEIKENINDIFFNTQERGKVKFKKRNNPSHIPFLPLFYRSKTDCASLSWNGKFSVRIR